MHTIQIIFVKSLYWNQSKYIEVSYLLHLRFF